MPPKKKRRGKGVASLTGAPPPRTAPGGKTGGYAADVPPRAGSVGPARQVKNQKNHSQAGVDAFASEQADLSPVQREEQASAKKYQWYARIFTVVTAAMLTANTFFGLALMQMTKEVDVKSFLMVQQNSSEDLVRIEPFKDDMVSADMLMEMYVRYYIKMYNSVVSDVVEMQARWDVGGLIYYMSAPGIYNKFVATRAPYWEAIQQGSMTREIEIIKLRRNQSVWEVSYNANDYMPKKRIIRTRIYRVNLHAFYLKSRVYLSRKLLNPLGFTVTYYTQSFSEEITQILTGEEETEE